MDREQGRRRGFAPVDRFEGAPEAHHPQRMLQGAKTVIVYGRNIPRGVMKSHDDGKHCLSSLDAAFPMNHPFDTPRKT